jgi:hypothetical protein
MKDHEPQRQLWARIAIALGYLTGVTLIVGWSLADGAVAYRRAELATSLPGSGASHATTEPARLVRARVGTRSNVNCAGCGVIESVRTIDRREEFAARCEAGDLAWSDVRGNAFAAGGGDVESLADTVAATIAGKEGMKVAAATRRHQIVVRFPDGTRLVFDEATPRTLRIGDRIKVIAGAVRTDG